MGIMVYIVLLRSKWAKCKKTFSSIRTDYVISPFYQLHVRCGCVVWVLMGVGVGYVLDRIAAYQKNL
jgi:hypothetical protein